MINLGPRGQKQEAMIFLICSLGEVEPEEGGGNKCKKSSLLKNLFKFPLKIFIMEKCSRLSIQGQDAVKPVMEKAAKMSKNAKHVKEMEESCRCSRWDLECISKSKNHAINVQVKAKSLERVENAKNVRAIKLLKNKS